MNRLGIVVIGRNEGERLSACLQSLAVTGAPIVYADSNSSDGSPERAEISAVTVVRLDPMRPMNAARGRKEGMSALLSLYPSIEFIFFIDGDCLLQPGFLDKAVDFLVDSPDVAVVCGQRVEAFPNASFYNRLCNEEWNTPIGEATACGGDSVIRVQALREVGSFDETLMASEEPELSARLRAAGWKIWRIDEVMTTHDAAIFDLRTYWRRHLRGGVGYFQAWRRTANLPTRINGRTLRSDLFWVILLPAAVIVAAVLARSAEILLTLPLIYAAQVGRLAIRNGGTLHAWRAAATLMLMKVAETLGALSALRTTRRDAIEYKGV